MQQISDKNETYNDGGLASLGFVGRVDHSLELLPLVQFLLRSFLNSDTAELTGAFFYDGQNVGEILEGPAYAVERRWQMMLNDETFKQLHIIGRKPIFVRRYPNWRMHAKDGEVVSMLFPELKRIIGDFNLHRTILETVFLACETKSLPRGNEPQASALPGTLH